MNQSIITVQSKPLSHQVLLGLLFLATICSCAKDPDLKRTKKAPLAKSESLLAESTEESPHRYSDHYESSKRQQPKGDRKYVDPQQRGSSNEEYGQMKDDEVMVMRLNDSNYEFFWSRYSMINLERCIWEGFNVVKVLTFRLFLFLLKGMCYFT